jgi:hypothetical protein
MWAWFQCRTSPKDICDVTIWPIHRVLLFIELCGANRPCIWPTSVLQKWACPMTKQFPVCWTSLARSDPSSLRVINIFDHDHAFFVPTELDIQWALVPLFFGPDDVKHDV